MISFAQNFEDVMLNRALHDIEKGFYIDVGANDPDIDSVTRFFYEKGWSGINLEPVRSWHERLLKCRPRDINLNVAAGEIAGHFTLHEVVNSGLSTLDESLALSYQHQMGYQIQSQEIEVIPLDNILRDFAINHPIHFLKIDVEGHESQVLSGLSLQKIRPWIILIEAVKPGGMESSTPWEAALLASGYHHVYFDGLNRFYLAEEQLDRRRFFEAPPNVFDRFELSGTATSTFSRRLTLKVNEIELANAELKQELAKSSQALSRLHSELTVQNQELTWLRQEYDWVLNEIDVIHGSHSWRLTRPIRWAGFQLRLLKQHGPLSRLKSLVLRLLGRTPYLASSETSDALAKSSQTGSSRMTRRAHGLSEGLRSMTRKEEISK